MRKMSLTDAFFLINESRRTPMHVASVSLYSLPADVDDTTFLADLKERLRFEGPMRHPFGQRIKTGPLGVFGNIYWEDDPEIDLDYHLRHSALPKPGRYRELFVLASRLHGTLLDRSRPLWELHLIEGLQNRQFAAYFKAHHCAMDGVAGMHLLQSMYSDNPDHRSTESPFSLEAYKRYRSKLEKREVAPAQARESDILAVADVLREQLGGAVNVTKALQRYAGVWIGMGDKLAVPWRKIPKTPFSTRVSGARRFVAQSWPIERLRNIGKAFDGTLNDAVLAMCAGALRRYLIDQDRLPAESLKAMAPISLRAEGDIDSANAIGFLTADLATNLSDPTKRVRRIQESMRAGKEQLRGMSATEVQVYNVVTQAPQLLLTLTGLASKFPAFSTVISNVPGPRQAMYWNGARLDGLYPVSIPFDGFAMNITLVSNNQNLDFGIVACRHSVPQVQRIIDHMEDALVELEDVVDQRSKRGAAGPARKRAQDKKVTGLRAGHKKVSRKKASRKKASRKKESSKSARGRSAASSVSDRKIPLKKRAARKTTRKKTVTK